MVHNFKDSLEYGEGVELILDGFFEPWFDITPVTPDQQRLGVDRIFTKLSTGERFSVEYKADRQAHETRNVYIETVSVRKEGKDEKLGWAYTSTAQRLLYFIPGSGIVYILDMIAIRDKLPAWTKKYRTVEADNGDYVGEGILVPVAELDKLARGKMVYNG